MTRRVVVPIPPGGRPDLELAAAREWRTLPVDGPCSRCGGVHEPGCWADGRFADGTIGTCRAHPSGRLGLCPVHDAVLLGSPAPLAVGARP